MSGGGEGAILKVVQGRSPVSAWTFGGATRDARIRVGSGDDATWRFVSHQVAPAHFELFWDGTTLWVASPYGAPVHVDGAPVGDWQPLHGRFRIQFGDAAIEGRAPEANGRAGREKTTAWHTREVLPPPDAGASPAGFQAARDTVAPGLDAPEELPGEPTVYLRDEPPAPAPPPPQNAWEDEPTRAEPLPELEEDRPTATPAAPPSTPPIQSEATVFAPLPDRPEPAAAQPAPVPAPPPVTPGPGSAGPDSVRVDPALAPPSAEASPKEPPPPTFVLPPEPTRRGFFAKLFARRPQEAPAEASGPTSSDAGSPPAADDSGGWLQRGPVLFGVRPVVWLPVLVVLLGGSGALVARNLSRRAAPRTNADRGAGTQGTDPGAKERVDQRGATGEARHAAPRAGAPRPPEPTLAGAPAAPSPTAAGDPEPGGAADPAPSGQAPENGGVAQAGPGAVGQGSAPYPPARAVEWLVAGRLRAAATAYEGLARAHPQEAAFAAAAEILRKEVASVCASAEAQRTPACAPAPPPPPQEDRP